MSTRTTTLCPSTTLFPAQLDAARALGAPVVELHTGSYCEAAGQGRARELERIRRAAAHAEAIGLECHAGHGLTFDTVGAEIGRHTSELQSLMRISYAVFCLKKKKCTNNTYEHT